MLLSEITKTVNWVLPSGKDLKADFDEYKLKETQKWKSRANTIGARFPLFGDLDQFEADIKSAKIISLSDADWNSIHNLTRLSSMENIKEMVSGYFMPRDVDRIVKGITEGAKLPYALVICGSKGRWIMAGNTRLNVANALGYPAKALEINVRS
jgi:hypothetical protein